MKMTKPMINTISEMITGIFPSTKRAERFAKLEQVVDATADELRKRTENRRERNSETRLNMRARRVHGAYNSS